MVVTIDGPAGAGKSSVAKRVADALGFRYLDTGAMYRALTLAGLEQHWPWDQCEAVAAAARSIQLHWDGQRLSLNNRDVTDRIRQEDVTRCVHLAADNPLIREHLTHLQREIAQQGSVVTEGRDQGTVVFPDATCKIFLTASPAERARRRMRDLQATPADAAQDAPLENVLQWINERDARDRQRPVGALSQAEDAIVVDTTGLSEDEVVEALVALVRSCQDRAS